MDYGGDEKSNSKDENRVLFENVDGDEFIGKAESKKWHISGTGKGRASYLHMSRPIKMLLPCEFIFRNCSQRHIVSVYLPGKSPLDPANQE